VGSELRLEASEPVVGYVDQIRIEQVMTNLISNAIKYGAGKPIAIELTGNGEEAKLTVRDQGIGIAPEAQERIFNRFERATQARAGESLGLGLFITREIVYAHGGEIQVSSEPGKGSTFTVRIPLKRFTGAQGNPKVNL
jgi:signal transduction histidine kinase